MKRNQGPNGLHRVLYVKNFLTGTLAGLQVRCSYTVPAADCHTHQLRLNDFTRENPGSDAITGAAWFTSGVGCEEIKPEEQIPVSSHDWVVQRIELTADAKKFGENRVMYPYWVAGWNLCGHQPERFFWNLPAKSLENPRYDLTQITHDERGTSVKQGVA